MTANSDQLADVIALHASSRCQYQGRCRRSAVWLVDAHGCENRLMCDEHRTGYERHVRRVLAVNGKTMCTLCGRTFVDMPSVVQAVAL
jgi:hypothetical protein